MLFRDAVAMKNTGNMNNQNRTTDRHHARTETRNETSSAQRKPHKSNDHANNRQGRNQTSERRSGEIFGAIIS